MAVATVLVFAAAAGAATPYTWTAANVGGVSSLNGVSCPSPDLCVAVDAAGEVIPSDNPAGGVTAWGLPEGIVGAGSMTAISCPSVNLCVAVDSLGNEWHTTTPTVVGSWTGSSINLGAQLRSISCPSVTLCVAAGFNGNVVWSTSPTTGPWTIATVDAPNALFSISCPSASLCVAGDDAGNVVRTTNPTGTATAWTAPLPIAPASVVRGMSCPTTAFCIASNDAGSVVTTTVPMGVLADWTLAVVDGFAFIYGVSCSSASACVAADSAGKVLSSTNPAGGVSAWGSAIVNVGAVNAVSCPTAAFCVAAASGGNAIVGVQPTLSVTTGGTGIGSVAGSGIACPGTCSQFYASGTGVTLTPTAAPDGSTFSGWSGDCTGTGSCVLTMSSARAVTASFAAAPVAGASTPIVPSEPPPEPVATAAQAGPPPPVANQTANARPVSGTVLVREPGTAKSVPLKTPDQVRTGTIFDTRRGAVEIVIANRRGGFDRAVFSQGVFRLVLKGGFAELRLVGGSFKGCPKAAKGGVAVAAAKARGRSVRHLWGNGSGSFRTKGRFASATVRGTKWLTDDRCFGTLARVVIGSVVVRDLVKRRNVVLRAPKSYFARAASY